MVNFRANKDSKAQRPLGDLLIEARKSKKLTRQELADVSKIGVNSIVRYEKAGLEEDGQYPSAPKLAKLCHHLDIPPTEAFWSCLTPSDFDDVGMEKTDVLMDHPEHRFVKDQYEVLVKDNHFLKEALRAIVGLNPEFPYDEQDHHWLLGEIRSITDRIHDFECRMLELGCAEFNVNRMLGYREGDATAWKMKPSMPGTIVDPNDFPNLGWVWSTRDQLAGALNKIDEHFPKLATMNSRQLREAQRRRNKLINTKNSEDDLASPPSSESVET